MSLCPCVSLLVSSNYRFVFSFFSLFYILFVLGVDDSSSLFPLPPPGGSVAQVEEAGTSMMHHLKSPLLLSDVISSGFCCVFFVSALYRIK